MSLWVAMQIWPTMARQRLKSVKAGCFDHKRVVAANALYGDAAGGGGLRVQRGAP